MCGHYLQLVANKIEWFCNTCNENIFLFTNVPKIEFDEFFSVDLFRNQPLPNKNSKCGQCLKKVKRNVSLAFCKKCSNFYHLQCCKLKKSNFPLEKDWQCLKCILHLMPFSNITDDNMLLTLRGFTSASSIIQHSYFYHSKPTRSDARTEV